MLGRLPSLRAWVKNLNCMIKLVMMDVPPSKQTKCYPFSRTLVAGLEAIGRNAHHGFRQEEPERVL